MYSNGEKKQRFSSISGLFRVIHICNTVISQCTETAAPEQTLYIRIRRLRVSSLIRINTCLPLNQWFWEAETYSQINTVGNVEGNHGRVECSGIQR